MEAIKEGDEAIVKMIIKQPTIKFSGVRGTVEN